MRRLIPILLLLALPLRAAAQDLSAYFDRGARVRIASTMIRNDRVAGDVLRVTPDSVQLHFERRVPSELWVSYATVTRVERQVPHPDRGSRVATMAFAGALAGPAMLIGLVAHGVQGASAATTEEGANFTGAILLVLGAAALVGRVSARCWACWFRRRSGSWCGSADGATSRPHRQRRRRPRSRSNGSRSAMAAISSASRHAASSRASSPSMARRSFSSFSAISNASASDPLNSVG